MYINGYRIYGLKGQFRKGTAILVSNTINSQAYIVMKSQKGRYLKLKIKSEETDRTNYFKHIPRIREREFR